MDSSSQHIYHLFETQTGPMVTGVTYRLKLLITASLTAGGVKHEGPRAKTGRVNSGKHVEHRFFLDISLYFLLNWLHDRNCENKHFHHICSMQEQRKYFKLKFKDYDGTILQSRPKLKVGFMCLAPLAYREATV